MKSKPLTTIVLLLVACSAFSATIAVTTNGGASGLTPYSRGFSFTVGPQPLEVFEFGVYDHQNDGLTTQNEVDLWTDSGTLLASKIFPTGKGATYDSLFRWLSVTTPIVLSANATYRIAAFSLTGEYGKDVFIPDSDTTIAPEILFGSGYGTNNHSIPTFPTINQGNQLNIRANFRYNVVTPEPTSAFLAVIGGFVLLSRRHRIR